MERNQKLFSLALGKTLAAVCQSPHSAYENYWNKATKAHTFLNPSSCFHSAEHKVSIQVRAGYLKPYLGIWGLVYSKYKHPSSISARISVADNRIHFI